jgi:hypothetical protein
MESTPESDEASTRRSRPDMFIRKGPTLASPMLSSEKADDLADPLWRRG